MKDVDLQLLPAVTADVLSLKNSQKSQLFVTYTELPYTELRPGSDGWLQKEQPLEREAVMGPVHHYKYPF